MGKENAESYLGAIKTSLNSPNMILDLRIPQNQRYQQIVPVCRQVLASAVQAAGGACSAGAATGQASPVHRRIGRYVREELVVRLQALVAAGGLRAASAARPLPLVRAAGGGRRGLRLGDAALSRRVAGERAGAERRSLSRTMGRSAAE